MAEENKSLLSLCKLYINVWKERSEVCSGFQVNSYDLPVVELLETLHDFLKVAESLCDFHPLTPSNSSIGM